MDSTFLFIVLAIVGTLALFVFILRTVFRINDIVENQKKTIQLLAKLIELKKRQMGLIDQKDKV